MRFLNTVLMILTIIGGFNWFLMAVFNFNIVGLFFSSSVMQKAAYVVIGFASLYCISLLKVIYKSK